jgi:carnitine O-acetyltransferase
LWLITSIFCARHLYALYRLLRREPERSGDASVDSLDGSALPEIFRDSGWSTLGTSILSTSNCGNPALRLFGFGPVAADGYSLGYVIKDDGVSVCAASKHLQTRRFLDTLQGYLEEVQRVLVALVRAANERPEPFIDHAGILRDSKTGQRIDGSVLVSDEEEEVVDSMRASFLRLFPFLVFRKWDDLFSTATYSFFDSYDVELVGRTRKRQDPYTVGKFVPRDDRKLGEWILMHSDCRNGHPFGGVLSICLQGLLDVYVYYSAYSSVVIGSAIERATAHCK